MTNTEKKNNLIILTGPTAVGKTALSLKLANDVGGEIVSADSIQVYKHFDIGSAKILPEEMQGIPHHLIDILEPKDSFNVMEFKKYAEEAMAGIYERGRCSGRGIAGNDKLFYMIFPLMKKPRMATEKN